MRKARGDAVTSRCGTCPPLSTFFLQFHDDMECDAKNYLLRANCATCYDFCITIRREPQRSLSPLHESGSFIRAKMKLTQQGHPVNPRDPEVACNSLHPCPRKITPLEEFGWPGYM